VAAEVVEQTLVVQVEQAAVDKVEVVMIMDVVVQ
jgi:hypothetical protein